MRQSLCRCRDLDVIVSSNGIVVVCVLRCVRKFLAHAHAYIVEALLQHCLNGPSSTPRGNDDVRLNCLMLIIVPGDFCQFLQTEEEEEE